MTRTVMVGGVAAVLAAVGPAQWAPTGSAAAAPAADATTTVATARPSHIRVGGTPPVPSRAAALGGLAGRTPLHVTVTLQPSHPAALARLAASVATPGSRLYRRYLRPAQFVRQFGASASTVRAVDSQLRAAGLHPGVVTADHLAIPVSGMADDVGRAFATGFERYRLAGGRVAYANTAAPRVARGVQGVIGLSNVSLPRRLGVAAVRPAAGRGTAATVRPHVVTGGPQPCAAASSAGGSDDAYTDDQIASAYGFSSLYGAGDLGAGQTVALFELEPDLTTDIAAFQSCFGTSAAVSYATVDGGAGTGAGEGEAALDIDNVIGLAPKAAVDVYQGPNSDTGSYDTYNAIISQDHAAIVSTSWGNCESVEGSSAVLAENTLFKEAALQGQTIVAAAGDKGSEDCGGSTTALAVDDPASQPYVTGVGGTTLSSLGPPPTESAWDERALGGGSGGGGMSKEWKMPSYQSGAASSLHVVGADSSGSTCDAASGGYCRQVPDVSADADPYTGYVIYYDRGWIGLGGTSGAAPLWAAFLALTNASTSCKGADIGFANPTLYRVAGTSGYSRDFHDITTGNNDYTGSHGGDFPAGTGYDMATGLGSPDGSTLPAALCTSRVDTIEVTNPGTQVTTGGTAVSLQIAAHDSKAVAMSYRATGLPPGLSINATSGLISGVPTTPATNHVIVTVKDATDAVGTASFVWYVESPYAGASQPTG